MKIAKIYSQITIAAWMQPLQYDLRCSAAKDNSITHAAAAPSNLDAATTMRSADTELQNTIELRATVSKIAAPKPDGSRRQSRKKTILKHFLKGFLKGKLLPWKLRKSTRKSLSQPGCSHSNTIYDVRLQKTKVLRMQPRHRATLTQPLQCDLQTLSYKTQYNYAQQYRKLQLQNRMSTPKQKNDSEALFKRIFKRNISTVKIAKIYSQITIAAWMQPLQYDLRCSAAKDNSITHAAAAPSNVEHTRCRAPVSSPKHSPCNIHAAITMRSATTASGNA